MRAESGFVKVFFVVLSLITLAVTGVHADPGTPFWSMYVGNSWDYCGHNPGSPCSWTYRVEVTGPDVTTIPGQKTFVMREYENGTAWERDWFSITLSEMRLWRMEIYEDLANPPIWHTVTIDGGFTVGKSSVVVGDQWTESKTGTYDGNPLSLTLAVTVESYGLITVPCGTYKAYKINLSLNSGQMVRKRWFVPYLGFVYREDGTSPDIDIEELTSMSIRKGIVDFDGDGKTDIGVYHSASGLWFIKKSSDGTPYSVGYGGPDYKPVPGDYDGDGKTDIAVYHVPSGLWFITKSSDGTSYYVGYGGSGYVPVPGDYDDDAKTDIAVYHSASGLWFIKPSSGAADYYVGYGGSGYTPVNMDYLHGYVY